MTRNLSARCVLTVLVVALPLLHSGCAANRISPFALREDYENFAGRHIGGGKVFGHARLRREGTWARDFAGWDLLRWIELRWSHSSRVRQGGIGSY